jgi:hypothetical protein
VSTDLVSRLRRDRDDGRSDDDAFLKAEAADEIERLDADRAERERLRALIAERELDVRHERDRLKDDLELLTRSGCRVREYNGRRFVEIESDLQP